MKKKIGIFLIAWPIVSLLALAGYAIGWESFMILSIIVGLITAAAISIIYGAMMIDDADVTESEKDDNNQ